MSTKLSKYDDDVATHRLAFMIPLLAISTILVIVRLQVKCRMVRNLGPEDILCVAALVRHELEHFFVRVLSAW